MMAVDYFIKKGLRNKEKQYEVLCLYLEQFAVNKKKN